jgi:hypothetical protein
VQEHLDVSSLVDDLRREEDLRHPVRGHGDETARPLERCGLADAVVAEDRDQAVPLLLGQLRVRKIPTVSVATSPEIPLDGVEPELEGMDLLQEPSGFQPVELAVLVRQGPRPQGRTGV